MAKFIKHYPTPTTTTYYVDEYLIDDIFRVDFQRKATEQPIWGYGSRTYDFVARGREIVTGNIIINFRYPGYLRNVIQLKKSADDRLTDQMVESKLIENPDGFFATSSTPSSSPAGMSSYDDNETNAHKMQVLSDLAKQSLENGAHPNSGPVLHGSIEQAKEFLITRNIFMNRGQNAQLPVSSLASPLDGPSGAHPFDMTVRYGFQGVPGGFVRRFSEVVLIGESQVVQASAAASAGGGDVASSAQALLEIYPFFAKTIVVEKYNG